MVIWSCGGDYALSMAKILKQEHLCNYSIGTDIHENHPAEVFDLCLKFQKQMIYTI